MRLASPGKNDSPARNLWRNLLNSSGIWLSLLAILAAAILRLGYDLSGGWRAAYQAAFLPEDLHASSLADYSADAFFGFIPALRPGIIGDLGGIILPGPDDFAAEAPGSITPSPTAPAAYLAPPTGATSSTPTLQPSQPIASATPGASPTPGHPTATATSNSFPALTSTPSPTQPVVESPTPRTPAPTRTAPPPITPTPTRLPSDTPTPPAPPTNTPRPSSTNTPRPSPVTDTPQPSPPTDTPQPSPPTNTPRPPPPTNTPFATRDPTRAVTPTAVYTPGGTAAPITPAPADPQAAATGEDSPAGPGWLEWLGSVLSRLGI